MSVTQQLKTIEHQIILLEPLCRLLKASAGIKAKLKIVDASSCVNQFLKDFSILQHLIKTLDHDAAFVVKTLIAIGQGPAIFCNLDDFEVFSARLPILAQSLIEIEKFYEAIGGIAGYQLTVLKLLREELLDAPDIPSEEIQYYEPRGIDVSIDSLQIRQAVKWGIENIDKLAEIYPLGGAGDRLNLHDEINGCPLPVAQLLFCGKTLLEGIIQDLQGREYLYYKLFNKQVLTPLAIMTSHEKNNHERILNICKDKQWFGRPEDSMKFFLQPLVPMVTENGIWAIHGPLQPIFKPGGHGVMWKAALDHGVFEWLEHRNRNKALVRQINNPAAGIDNGLLALYGLGVEKKKSIGFASCPRLLNVAEGMNVLCEKKVDNEYEYCITNIEYTEFQKRKIEDTPKELNSPYSRFPANTNILFINLETIKQAAKRFPIPGVLINMKNHVDCQTPDGNKLSCKAGRLESTMQNIADHIVDKFSQRLHQSEEGILSSFITYNERRKTISVTKQAYQSGRSLVGTPEACYFELLQNYRDLLTNYCSFSLPSAIDEKTYLAKGPEFIAHFHPALGVLFPVISQKIRLGHFAHGAELILEIAEVDISNIHLEGSLLINAKNLMGGNDEQGQLTFNSMHCGKCILKHVRIKNKGIDRTKNNLFWKRSIYRTEALSITLHGNAEFHAEEVAFEGDLNFEVPNGYRLSISQKEGEYIYRYDKIDRSTWHWNYAFDNEHRIVLTKECETQNLSH